MAEKNTAQTRIPIYQAGKNPIPYALGFLVFCLLLCLVIWFAYGGTNNDSTQNKAQSAVKTAKVSSVTKKNKTKTTSETKPDSEGIKKFQVASSPTAFLGDNLLCKDGEKTVGHFVKGECLLEDGSKLVLGTGEDQQVYFDIDGDQDLDLIQVIYREGAQGGKDSRRLERVAVWLWDGEKAAEAKDPAAGARPLAQGSGMLSANGQAVSATKLAVDKDNPHSLLVTFDLLPKDALPAAQSHQSIAVVEGKLVRNYQKIKVAVPPHNIRAEEIKSLPAGSAVPQQFYPFPFASDQLQFGLDKLNGAQIKGEVARDGNWVLYALLNSGEQSYLFAWAKG